MSKYAAPHLQSVKPSASAMISQHAKEMRAAGNDVLDLGLGEPNFDTPKHIIEYAHQAALHGQTRYPPTVGTDELKAAIQKKFHQDNALAFNSEQLIVSNGAKQVIFNALMATVQQGDEVLLVAPYFDSYRNIISLLGAQKRVAQTKPSDGFRLTPEGLAAGLTDKTRWLLLSIIR